ncbi:c-type cytochrome [Consotaella salsifontis]|uniref:Cytochrome c, mono-and diheme variants n=1 Tax=Consotaella salsifontis TaxID=1365950 RepID=A0A1T4NNG4_9HYPH|nr:cytochrome c [Consotaella salsifontis]SJZ80749.1 Cytochrome c, mono-and diheme variants [Consotaella salsifontis]
MAKRLLLILIVLLALGAGLFFWLTEPTRMESAALAEQDSGDAKRGERVFWLAGCESCHARPDAKGEAQLELAGGLPLKTDFGTFYAPNISPDPDDGIGRWTFADFANALQRGVDPEGRHLYPAFPYTSYVRMKHEDVADLWAFMKTLPQVKGRAPDHELSFPFNIRRGIGLWKLAFLSSNPVVTLPASASDAARAGQYLVEGPAHCGECHTPRRFAGAGGLDHARWLGGAPNPEGEGKVPNITPAADGLGSWSADEIAEYLATGFTPDFDTVGGAMVAVQENMAKLPDEDRQAIAAYLKAVPAVD